MSVLVPQQQIKVLGPRSFIHLFTDFLEPLLCTRPSCGGVVDTRVLKTDMVPALMEFAVSQRRQSQTVTREAQSQCWVLLSHILGRRPGIPPLKEAGTEPQPELRLASEFSDLSYSTQVLCGFWLVAPSVPPATPGPFSLPPCSLSLPSQGPALVDGSDLPDHPLLLKLPRG